MSTNIPNPSYGIQGYGIEGYGNEPIGALPIGYYMNLVTSEYRLAPKFNALLLALLKKLDDVTNCLILFDVAFDLSTAVGAQLDIWGDNLNISRTVGFQPSNGVSPVLDDDTFRLYIQAVIAANHWDGTIDGLYSVWEQLFPDGSIIIIDNQNMTVDITLTGTFSSIIQDLITNGYIVPRPEGVLYNYLFGTLPFFGFGESVGYVEGFDEGHWATERE